MSDQNDRNRLLQALSDVGLKVVSDEFVPPDRRVGLPWSWNITFELPDRDWSAALVDGPQGVVADPTNRSLRHFLARIATEHGFVPFDIGDPAFGWSAMSREHGTIYTFSLDANGW